MVNKSYKKGYRFEIRVKKYLEKLGYKVFRLAGSKPLDLIAFSRKEVYLIECKYRRTNLNNARKKILELSKGIPIYPIIAVNVNGNIKFLDAETGKEIRMEYVNPLDNYL